MGGVNDGSGTGYPAFRSHSMCKSIASKMSVCTSSNISPTAMHPGRSGTYAPELSSPFILIHFINRGQES